MIEVGKKAPDFTLPDENGEPVKLSEYRGKRVIVFFYPKAMTTGCTREACDFRDEVDALKRKDAVVLGVSRDTPAAQRRFKDRYQLPFPLLSDGSTQVHRTFGAWGEKNLYGKKTEGAIRTTVVVGADGKVEAVFPKVKVDGHVAKVLESL